MINFKSGWLPHPVLCQGISWGLTSGGGQEWAAYTGPTVKRNVHQAEALGQVLDAFLPLSHSSPFLQFWLCDCLCDVAAKQLQEIEWTQKENLSPIKTNLLHDHGSPADVLMLVKRQWVGVVTSLPLPASLFASCLSISVQEQGSSVLGAVLTENKTIPFQR